mmetsp:Transcript_25178/g.73883  ORF Transcript_25178/g.73883 Transcript_25178/m.73883 type:complete len:242 (-) Transcript_25178:566-1291(-)
METETEGTADVCLRRYDLLLGEGRIGYVDKIIQVGRMDLLQFGREEHARTTDALEHIPLGDELGLGLGLVARPGPPSLPQFHLPVQLLDQTLVVRIRGRAPLPLPSSRLASVIGLLNAFVLIAISANLVTILALTLLTPCLARALVDLDRRQGAIDQAHAEVQRPRAQLVLSRDVDQPIDKYRSHLGIQVRLTGRVVDQCGIIVRLLPLLLFGLGFSVELGIAAGLRLLGRRVGAGGSRGG